MLILATVAAYFIALFLFSRLSSKGAGNDAFYRGNRQSPWYMVAFGMVGASISGVTFISVPGMVIHSDMTYLQTCLGFILGYFAVAFVLLPIYYRLNLTTIYTYLSHRLGKHAYKTGATFFLISKMSGAAARFYVVCLILQRFVVDSIGNIPFTITVVAMVALIWLYTRRGGIKTLVWTDTFQTICMLTALICIIYNVVSELNLTLAEAVETIKANPYSRIFVFDDWLSKQNFWKQFLSGIFIVMVMTGLDQDMMQKNLTCKNLREAQKDMCTYGLAFVPVNLLFLSLGVLLAILAQQRGLTLPAASDELLPMFAASGALGNLIVILFTIGIVAASFSSADSALTAMTTCYCIDIREQPANEQLRRQAHVALAVVFTLVILLFKTIHSTSVIEAIYIMCSYTYGPLLGLFSFAILTNRTATGKAVPLVAIAAPIACHIVDIATQNFLGYKFGYELLMLNGAITFIGLWSISKPRPTQPNAIKE